MPVLASAAPVPVDPDSLPMPCELCGHVKPKGEMRSLAVIYSMPGGGAAGYLCPVSSPQQHFACCHEHAVLAALCCLFEHIDQGPHEARGQEYSHPLLAQLKADLATLVVEEVREEQQYEESGTLVPDREA